MTNKLNVIKKYLLSVRNKLVIAERDNGDTNNYWREAYITCLKNFIQVIGPNITLPDHSVLISDQ